MFRFSERTNEIPAGSRTRNFQSNSRALRAREFDSQFPVRTISWGRWDSVRPRARKNMGRNKKHSTSRFLKEMPLRISEASPGHARIPDISKRIPLSARKKNKGAILSNPVSQNSVRARDTKLQIKFPCPYIHGADINVERICSQFRSPFRSGFCENVSGCRSLWLQKFPIHSPDPPGRRYRS